ncbi:MAG TPA: serine hydrolase domain-containing protein [Woeseiaceae bacterium]|nr:serine hydrolase domain-containing protein [Woeseiaceae bacterium]
MRYPGLAAALLALAACGGGDGGVSAGTAQQGSLVDPGRIDAVLSGYVARGELVGVSALVYERGEEAYFGAFGMADREAERPLARDSLVRIYSMTKPVTGVTLMTFYDEGRFELDEPLERYLPEYAGMRVFAGMENGEPRLVPAERPPTIRDVLRHTAGFAGGGEEGWLGERWREADLFNPGNTLADVSAGLAALPLAYQPGTQWRYGPSVDVQARLVEVLSGKPFEAVVRERVLVPLGMEETQYRLGPGQRERLTALYERLEDGSFRRLPDDDPRAAYNLRDPVLTPGGWGLTSTLDDYVRFARMLLGGGALDGVRILQPETVRLMATDALPPTIGDKSWLPSKGQVGFGIDFAVRIAPPIDQAEASGAVGEFFWDGAANTLFWVDPANEIAAVLFNYYMPFGQTEIQKDFRDAVYYRDEVASALTKPPAGPGSRRLSD